MQKRQKELLENQLRDQADSLMGTEGDELLNSIIATSNMFLKAVEVERKSTSLDDAQFENVYVFYTFLGNMASAFFDEAKERLISENKSAEFTALTEELNEKNSEIQMLREKREKTFKDSRMIEADVDAQRKKYEEAKAEYESLTQDLESLKRMMEKVSPSVIEAQIAANEKLNEEYINANIKMHKLKDKNNELKQKLAGVEQEIGDIPEENSELLRAYNEKASLLKKLLSAKEEYSDEKRAMLEKEIGNLTPEVEKNKEEIESLRTHVTDLKAKIAEQNTEREDLSADLTTAVSECLNELGSTVSDKEGKLKTAKQTADALTNSICECLEMEEEFADWLKADSTPLDAMKVALNNDEFVQLKQTLNLQKIQSVSALKDEIKEKLVDMDKIIRGCMKAAQLDRATIEAKARR